MCSEAAELVNLKRWMREDWDRRASEDPYFYSAFARRGQSEQEFQATAVHVVRSLIHELGRFGAGAEQKKLRVLEIGCGPGRLMLPLSQMAGEVHGVDVSLEMLRAARRRLAGYPNAHLHLASGTNLAQFRDETFDFVYSYAVFQHIPSREVIFGYLAEAVRVLRPGGVLRCQLDGRPEEEQQRHDTWRGARVSAEALRGWVMGRGDVQLLGLEGAGTQYMWLTVRKKLAGLRNKTGSETGQARIVRVSNAYFPEPVAAAAGRYRAVSLWVDNLLPEADLLSLEALVEGSRAEVTYIGPRREDGLVQLNLLLPRGMRTGLCSLVLRTAGGPVAPPARIRVVPRPPTPPRVVHLGDAEEPEWVQVIRSGWLKLRVEGVEEPEELCVMVNGRKAGPLEWEILDADGEQREINVRLPEGVQAGPIDIRANLGKRKLGQWRLEYRPKAGVVT